MATLKLSLSIFKLLLLASTATAFSPSKTKTTTISTTTSLSAGLGSTLTRISNSLQSKERTREELKIGIAGFYDRSSKLWEEVWGEHMHHGYYVPEDRTDHKQAQIDLIDEVLKWADVAEEGSKVPTNVVDVGCGVGGSSRHIAKKYNCKASGITLSPYQANRGNELAKEQGVDHLTNFQVSFILLIVDIFLVYLVEYCMHCHFSRY
jgi:tocopherol O-methyltransferase